MCSFSHLGLLQGALFLFEFVLLIPPPWQTKLMDKITGGQKQGGQCCCKSEKRFEDFFLLLQGGPPI